MISGFSPWVRKIRWRRALQPSPVVLPGEPHGQRTWWAAVGRVPKHTLSGMHKDIYNKKNIFESA